MQILKCTVIGYSAEFSKCKKVCIKLYLRGCWGGNYYLISVFTYNLYCGLCSDTLKPLLLL